jgi:hypothetical protein
MDTRTNAIGNEALYNNVNGSGNTAIGDGRSIATPSVVATAHCAQMRGQISLPVITILISATEALLASPIPSR